MINVNNLEKALSLILSKRANVKVTVNLSRKDIDHDDFKKEKIDTKN